jgi:transposase
MARERLPMRKIREVLRLKAEGLSERKIAASLGIGHSGAGDTIRRARQTGLDLAVARRFERRETGAASLHEACNGFG